MERHFSADFVNRVANDPSVYPWVCGRLDRPMDLTNVIKDTAHVALMGEHGGFVFFGLGNGVFDAHSLVLPSGRGKWALKAAKESMNWIFDHGATEVLMLVPKGNLAVLSLVRCLCATFRETMPGGWVLAGEQVDADVYSVTKKDWQCLSQQ